MTWPVTLPPWAALQKLKAFDLQKILDALGALGDAHTAASATVSAVGGGFALGNGSVAANYSSAGKRARAHIKFIVGTTTNMGSGRLQITIGGGIPQGIAGNAAGSATINDQSATSRYSGSAYWVTSTVLEIAGPTGSVSGTAPFTFASTDWIVLDLNYEAV
jgi:hypothetical protein